QSKGAVINTTISLFSHATLRKRKDERISVHSRDLGESIEMASLDHLGVAPKQFGLIAAILNVIKPEFGFDLFLQSDFPTKSGLGGSAVVAAAMLGCFNQFRRDQWDLHELA